MAAAVETIRQPETCEQRFDRLRREARELRPQSVGTTDEIERDTLAILEAWDDLRKDANRIG